MFPGKGEIAYTRKHVINIPIVNPSGECWIGEDKFQWGNREAKGEFWKSVENVVHMRAEICEYGGLITTRMGTCRI